MSPSSRPGFRCVHRCYIVRNVKKCFSTFSDVSEPATGTEAGFVDFDGFLAEMSK